MSGPMIGLFIDAIWQTLAMVLVSCVIAIIFGLPLGILLFITNKHQFAETLTLHRGVGLIVNVVRSIPFIILLVAITPLTRLITGTSIGTVAAMVPLTISAIPFFARLVESSLKEVPYGLLEAAQSMGAAPKQIISKVLIPESLPTLIRAVTLMLITLVGYSAMAGAVGGGGLGDLAIRYGYQRFNMSVMFWTVLILVLMVQFLQWGGDWLAHYLSHHKEGVR